MSDAVINRADVRRVCEFVGWRWQAEPYGARDGHFNRFAHPPWYLDEDVLALLEKWRRFADPELAETEYTIERTGNGYKVTITQKGYVGAAGYGEAIDEAAIRAILKWKAQVEARDRGGAVNVES
jgi:hypothetical protein